jgi:type II secretory pathway component PulK
VRVHAVDEDARARVGVRSDYFELKARVRYREAYAEATTLFRQDVSGDVAIVRRRMGADW